METRAEMLAEKLGITHEELVSAMREADQSADSDMISIRFRMPKRESYRDRSQIKIGSTLWSTAQALGIEPTTLRNALIECFYDYEPGASVSLTVRLKPWKGSFVAAKVKMARRAADQGDYWAEQYVRLVERLRSVARNP